MNQYQLGDIIEIKHGFAFSGEYITEEDNGVVLVTPGNFKIGGGFQEEKCKFFCGDIPEGYVLSAGDYIVTMTDLSKKIDTLGYSAIIPDTKNRIYLHNQRIGLIQFIDDSFDRDYIYYLMQTHSYQRVIANTSTGATVHHTSPSRIKEFSFCAPNKSAQSKISKALKVYDLAIQSNQKQIKLLEEAAQRLYKEWFVDLRFPGHETTPIVDGLPEGWKRKKLIDIADIQYGYAFDGSLFSTDKNGTPIVRIRNIPTGNTNDYTTEIADDQYLVYNGDIVVGMDGEFHINTWCGKTAYLVQRTCRIEPKQENTKGWLLQAIFSPIKYYEKTIVGATVAHLGKKHLDSIELLVGTENLYIPFQNIFEKRQILLNQNNELKEARDRLLPKLMNGEI